MSSIIFAAVCATMILISYYISHNIINTVSVFMAPYMVIVPINNLIMVNRGFFSISDQVLYMIGGCFFCIFIGYILANAIVGVKVPKNTDMTQLIKSKKFSRYRIGDMLKYVLFVEIVAGFRFLMVVLRHGITYIPTSAFEGYMIHGSLGHLLLTAYPIIPVLFLYWLKNKDRIVYLLATVLFVGLVFLTFVKYHIIGLFVLIFFFVALEDRKYVKKGVVIVSAVAISAFVLNYVISFFLRGTISKVSNDYYINHLWNYMAGSLIYDNRIFTAGILTDISILRKIWVIIFTVPNAFLYGFFGVRLFYSGKGLQYCPVGNNGEYGNVVDTFGNFFISSKGKILDLMCLVVFLILIGVVFTLIYNRAVMKSRQLRVTVCIFMTFFMFFSFFGAFYTLLPPWEILAWSVMDIYIFDKRKGIKIRWI